MCEYNHLSIDIMETQKIYSFLLSLIRNALQFVVFNHGKSPPRHLLFAFFFYPLGSFGSSPLTRLSRSEEGKWQWQDTERRDIYGNLWIMDRMCMCVDHTGVHLPDTYEYNAQCTAQLASLPPACVRACTRARVKERKNTSRKKAHCKIHYSPLSTNMSIFMTRIVFSSITIPGHLYGLFIQIKLMAYKFSNFLGVCSIFEATKTQSEACNEMNDATASHLSSG